MARIRTIKPQHVNDKELSKISLQAHLFWVLSWCFSDDEGVIENDPLLLRSQLFPRRTDIRVEQVQQWIDQLVKARFMIPFTHEGEGYLLHRTFKIHQKIDRPQPSKIPSDTIRRMIDEQSTNDQPCIVEESKVKDGSVKEEAQAPPAQKFSKPSIYELENFFVEKGLDEFTAKAQAKLFINYYESNGWKVGKNSMRSWHAAAGGWKERMNQYNTSKNGTNRKINSGSKSNSKTAGANRLAEDLLEDIRPHS
jgi:hypothetical protein